MLPVDYFIFRQWVRQHFNDTREKNGKIRLQSIFTEDRKFRLYCKPSIGMYKCMKSGQKGSLFHLVMQIEHCSYDEAVDILEGDTNNLQYLEAKLQKFLNPTEPTIGIVKKEGQEFVGIKNKLNFPPNTFLISSLGPTNHFRVRAEQYLKGRHLPNRGLLICVGGDYSNRIIIPYYDREGDLVYWNGRDLGNSYLRYRGPDAVLYPYAKKEEVVWMQYFPSVGTKVYLTEGEFDAMALNACGLHAAAFGGASFSPKQFSMLSGYQLVLAFDSDKAGKDGIMKLSEIVPQNGFLNTSYVRPAVPYKDWNEMLIKVGPTVVRHYIEKLENKHKIINEWNVLKMKNNQKL